MELIQCAACHGPFASDGVARRCPTCQKMTVGDDTYVNYARPEQPTRQFDQSDIYYLRQWLDERIRVLEGMRGVEHGRNYLHANDSGDLNRLKLMRGVLTRWEAIGPVLKREREVHRGRRK